jgi:hypothetical protein
MVSHDSYTIKNFCQRALYLRKGDFVGFGKSAPIVDQYSVEVENALAQSLVPASTDDTPKSIDIDAIGLGLFKISLIELLDSKGLPTSSVQTGETMTLSFRYTALAQQLQKVTFVVNLYRHDGLYICGTTTLMDACPPFSVGPGGGNVRVTFPAVRLLAGRYIWRVAINDERALGIFTEANQVCGFEVVDQLEAVGLFNLERVWSVTVDEE